MLQPGQAAIAAQNYREWSMLTNCESAARSSLLHFYLQPGDERLSQLRPDSASREGFTTARCCTPYLIPVAKAFHGNLTRLFSLPMSLMTMFVKGKASVMKTTPPVAGETCASADEIFAGMSELTPKFGGWFTHLMEMQIVACWTAFETLAGDLWVAAVNAQPSPLAMLSGSRTRIAKGKGKRSDEAKFSPDESNAPQDDKEVSLSDIMRLSRGTYDISHCMGSLLKRRFKFTSLSGIRRAYGAAFDPKRQRELTEGLDGVLADSSFDALSAVRNLIVHKSGVADDDYLEDMKSAPAAPKLTIGQRLSVTGRLVCDLIGPVTKQSVALLRAVDAWVAAAGGRSSGREPNTHEAPAS